MPLSGDDLRRERASYRRGLSHGVLWGIAGVIIGFLTGEWFVTPLLKSFGL